MILELTVFWKSWWWKIFFLWWKKSH